MPEGLQSRTIEGEESPGTSSPPVSVCRSAPGTVVFIESGNTDGWIATDAAVDPAP